MNLKHIGDYFKGEWKKDHPWIGSYVYSNPEFMLDGLKRFNEGLAFKKKYKDAKLRYEGEFFYNENRANNAPPRLERHGYGKTNWYLKGSTFCPGCIGCSGEKSVSFSTTEFYKLKVLGGDISDRNPLSLDDGKVILQYDGFWSFDMKDSNGFEEYVTNVDGVKSDIVGSFLATADLNS